MSDDIPMFAISNAELSACPPAADTVVCKRCGERHTVEYGESVTADGERSPCRLLGFVRCGGSSYIAVISGKEV